MRADDAREPTPYYGVIEDIVDAVPNSPYSRQHILIDSVRADNFDRDGASAIENSKALALVRIMSTPKRLKMQFKLSDPKPGDWLSFRLDDSGGIPRAWELPASNAYRSGTSRSVRDLRRISGPEDERLAGDHRLVANLVAASKSQTINVKRGTAAAALDQVGAGGQIEIIVLDVGQASATLIKRNGLPIGFFDIGAPVWFNRGSVDHAMVPPKFDQGFVILSHWDFDHFDLGRRHAPYQNLQWFAPDQPVGPNTARFQGQLGSRLTFIDGFAAGGGFQLSRGISALAGDRNGTGYQLRYDEGTRAVLLTADASYDLIEPTMLAGVGSLTIPHHGGLSLVPPPPAMQPHRAIASFGLPNRYRHPDQTTLSNHANGKWQVASTAAWQSMPRGDRILFP